MNEGIVFFLAENSLFWFWLVRIRNISARILKDLTIIGLQPQLEKECQYLLPELEAQFIRTE